MAMLEVGCKILSRLGVAVDKATVRRSMTAISSKGLRAIKLFVVFPDGLTRKWSNGREALRIQDLVR